MREHPIPDLQVSLIKSPWRDEFKELASGAKQQIFITSPYLSSNAVQLLFDCVGPNVKMQCLTRVNLAEYSMHLSEIRAVRELLEKNVPVRSHRRLHAKSYIFDRTSALTTSANFTTGGLYRNVEYGLLIQEPTLVNTIAQYFHEIYSGEEAYGVELDDVLIYENILASLPPQPNVVRDKQGEYRVVAAKQNLIDQLTGWHKDVFEAIAKIPKEEFVSEEAYQLVPELQAKYPGNKTIKDQIRKQLQYLRDMGLIEFVDNRGTYRKLWV